MIAHAYKRENGVTKEAIVIEWAAAAAWWKLGGYEKAMARCTTRCEMLLFRAKTIMRDWVDVELARLKKERRKKNNLPVLRVPGVVLSRQFFATRGVLLVMKTLKDERYVVIKAYKCAVSEIWWDFFVLAYIACTSHPYIQSLPTLWYTLYQYRAVTSLLYYSVTVL